MTNNYLKEVFMDLVKEGCNAEAIQRGLVLFPFVDKESVRVRTPTCTPFVHSLTELYFP